MIRTTNNQYRKYIRVENLAIENETSLEIIIKIDETRSRKPSSTADNKILKKT